MHLTTKFQNTWTKIKWNKEIDKSKNLLEDFHTPISVIDKNKQKEDQQGCTRIHSIMGQNSYHPSV